MPSIRIERAHRLGLKRAQAIARRWADEAERSYGLRCEVQPAADGDTIVFTRSGVQGRLDARADRFLLEAELGWTMLLMRARIEQEIETQLDAAIAADATRAPAAGAKAPGGGKSPASGKAAAAKKKPAPKAKPASPRGRA